MSCENLNGYLKYHDTKLHMHKQLRSLFEIALVALMFLTGTASAQGGHSGSFVAKLGEDTVIVETYHMTHNHLYGKAFLRYPEDQIGVFDFHFFPDGSIQHYSMAIMNPDSSFASNGIVGATWEADSCTWFSAWQNEEKEYQRKHAAKHLDFIGGWTPTLSLVEWNCMRLLKSGKETLPMILLNDYIGTKDIALYKGRNDTILFGGPFLEYTKITTTREGKILTYDGTSTPWNYIVTTHNLLDVDTYAKRLSKLPKIGIPSPGLNDSFVIADDTIQLSYGRPFKRGRKIFGGVVPYDSIWRTGANDPTKITLPYPIRIGKKTIAKGTYSVYTIPAAQKWTLILNTDLVQWPTDPDRSADYAAIPMRITQLNKSVEQFTIAIEPLGNGGRLKFTWDNIEASVPFEVLNH